MTVHGGLAIRESRLRDEDRIVRADVASGERVLQSTAALIGDRDYNLSPGLPLHEANPTLLKLYVTAGSARRSPERIPVSRATTKRSFDAWKRRKYAWAASLSYRETSALPATHGEVLRPRGSGTLTRGLPPLRRWR
jgi:hypothetical protein